MPAMLHGWNLMHRLMWRSARMKRIWMNCSIIRRRLKYLSHCAMMPNRRSWRSLAGTCRRSRIICRLMRSTAIRNLRHCRPSALWMWSMQPAKAIAVYKQQRLTCRTTSGLSAKKDQSASCWKICRRQNSIKSLCRFPAWCLRRRSRTMCRSTHSLHTSLHTSWCTV